jgi:hypothetical protein
MVSQTCSAPSQGFENYPVSEIDPYSNEVLIDPCKTCAQFARKNTDAFFAYDANYSIDNKAAIIVDAESTRADRIAEIAITETMIDASRTASIFGRGDCEAIICIAEI